LYRYASEELEVWRESAPKWKAQILELELQLKTADYDRETETAVGLYKYNPVDP
jgi:hypothetical protein